jgi:uncharacterized protein YlxW (UPF0749 family)
MGHNDGIARLASELLCGWTGPRVTEVTTLQISSIDSGQGGNYIAIRRFRMRDIYDVLRRKQAEQAQLGKQIEALQSAAEQLRSVAHLLDEDTDAPHVVAAGA